MNEQINQMIYEKGNGRRLKLQTSKFAIDLTPGSEESSMLLKAMIDTENREIFRGDLQILVDYKWDQMKGQVKIHTLVYFIFAMIISIDQIWS